MSAPSGDAELYEWLDYLDKQGWQTVEMGLGRTETMVARLGLERCAPHVITVAGTNGKGSTCLAMEALFLAHGIRVGTTLSPHIDRYNERIRIAGEELTDAEIIAAFVDVEAQRGDLDLTYFEFHTIATLLLFKRAGLDVAILEIGLGGRLDAFNAIDADVAVITSIGLDHQAFLGDTLEEIGAEKAGIMRRFPAERSPQQLYVGADMPMSVWAKADEVGVVAKQTGRDFDYAIDRSEWHFSSAQVADVDAIPLGSLAPANLALALEVVGQHMALEPASVRQTLGGLTMRGRLELREVAGRCLVLDVAHNPAGLSFLLNELALRRMTPVALVCGMLEDKDHRGVVDLVASTLPEAQWHLLDTLGYRSLPADELKSRVQDLLPEATAIYTSLDVLVADLHSATSPGDVILAFGSFSVVEQLQIGEPTNFFAHA